MHRYRRRYFRNNLFIILRRIGCFSPASRRKWPMVVQKVEQFQQFCCSLSALIELLDLAGSLRVSYLPDHQQQKPFFLAHLPLILLIL